MTINYVIGKILRCHIYSIIAIIPIGSNKNSPKVALNILIDTLNPLI